MIEQASEHRRIGRREYGHGLDASANFHVMTPEPVQRYPSFLADLLGHGEPAIQALGHVLQPRRDIDGVAKRREDGMAAKSDVADDHLTRVNANAVLDRFAHFRLELMIQVRDIRGTQRGSTQRLPARRRWIAIDA